MLRFGLGTPRRGGGRGWRILIQQAFRTMPCFFSFTDVFYFHRCLRIYADVDEALAMECLWHTVVFDCMIRVLPCFVSFSLFDDRRYGIGICLGNEGTWCPRVVLLRV